jgi:hypothetical protein
MGGALAGWISVGVVAMSLVSCGGTSANVPDARYPARAEGCAVKLSHDAPTLPTDNIGPVRVRCGFDVSETDCLRTLEDQVCKLGGDVVWGVPDKPGTFGDKNVWEARAAHTKTAPAATSEPTY